ncbi:valine--tRNA ligase [Flavobacteriaceae bacterium]|uniref:valine--tRNA ligase n=1 Tax=Candidatus Arcticimaribacter forsetii TaxID=2820661 RepID=UPI002077547A|nr:valine--tRNA ligase [Candidatus Arcticimaribacter forsetii]MDB2326040.1 valine--tRNA ligase [Flavobacteriaceae bacterium]MDB2345512.1 valine--tRNA ligase [Flavobacteriaceae bacterium]MDB2457099.1 valine--tRNA ligase [Flavobacteriaceae bacterium]MDB4674870.1 valine--tRNA ligase [Flavobacteriaceae bacterium]
MSISSKFEASTVEQKWYDYWLENKYFASTPDDRPAYSIVIPPPNVTGILHMGHMLNVSLQDILIRRARMQGFNACWVPGTDHASIATEAKVVARLKEQGIDKNDLSREEFLKHAWEWTDEYGGHILNQLQKLGASCDWDRTKFTLDDDMSESVIQVFVDLFNKGLIYRGYRMVNWDPEAQTTLSDEEVIFEEKPGFLYHIAYEVEGVDEPIIIATTRPETIFGDTAICIHPEDERYSHLKGKKAKVPIANRWIPIIEDDYVDTEFGTGCLKVTPAHDMNDKNLGDKHNLEVIDIFNADATLNAHGLHYESQDRFIVRKAISKELDDLGVLLKKEEHAHNVGTSERTKAVIEPRLSDQWFLKMEQLAEPAIKAVLESEEVALVPAKFKNTYRHWMENIRDWNISRQLWWGQQIPAYYYGNQSDDFVVETSPEKALELAKTKSGNPDLKLSDLKQDNDVLDTWFSSWLWPISVFDGIRNPENEEVNYYYPTKDLVTGPDILFFWVARMIISGYEYRKERPFSKVYLTGLVRDKQGRKMSKQLGNSPDALKLIEDFGADAVRVGLMLSSAAGNDLLFDESLCQQGKNFSNKIWNAYRLIEGWEVDESRAFSVVNKEALHWYSQKFQQSLELINDHFEKYRISDALMTSYKLIWDDFCSWLLEAIKPAYGDPIDGQTYREVRALFEENLKLLHPFMPFLTEELWQDMEIRSKEEALIVSKWPEVQEFEVDQIRHFDETKAIIGGIRNFRKEKELGFKETLSLQVIGSSDRIPFESLVQKMGQLTEISYVEVAPDQTGGSFRANNLEFFIPLEGKIDLEKERLKLEEELKYANGFLMSVQKKLSNERFVSNAPEQVLANERKKEADALEKIEVIKKSLSSL